MVYVLCTDIVRILYGSCTDGVRIVYGHAYPVSCQSWKEPLQAVVAGVPVFSFTANRNRGHCRGMKPISVKNEYGETIDIKWDADGNIKIRHSDIDPKRWGDLHEHAKRIRQPGPRAVAERVGQAHGVDLESPEAKEMLARMGGYMLIRGESYIVSAGELKLIYDAIREAGGGVPNWSSHP